MVSKKLSLTDGILGSGTCNCVRAKLHFKNHSKISIFSAALLRYMYLVVPFLNILWLPRCKKFDDFQGNKILFIVDLFGHICCKVQTAWQIKVVMSLFALHSHFWNELPSIDAQWQYWWDCTRALIWNLKRCTIPPIVAYGPTPFHINNCCLLESA